MKVAVIGTSYVGLPTAVGLVEKGGHDVVVVGRNKEKLDMINKGVPPIYEKGLRELLEDAVSSGKLKATNNIEEAVANSEITLVAVGTPSGDDGSIDLSQVETVCKEVGEVLAKKDDYHVVVMKSTVIPGTTEEFMLPLLEKHSGKKAGADFGICMNPEFLREGLAVEDFLNPDRIVVGEIDQKAGDIAEEMYKEFTSPILRTGVKTAEMIKYVSNSLLALKISFINEIGNMCKMLGIDAYDVAKGVGMDHRISKHFLRAGPGFGGSCFPKDVNAILYKAKQIKADHILLEGLLEVNRRQPLKFVELVKTKVDLKDKRVGVLGLAFKGGTDDMRYSPAVPIINAVVDKGATVCAYDPQAAENAKKILGDKINYVGSVEEALKDADLALVVTEWEEFSELDVSGMKSKKIFDARHIVNTDLLPHDTEYEGFCW